MSERQQRILSELKSGTEVTGYYLSCILDAPEASIRRDIQVLRRQGWNISRLSTSRSERNGYRLFQ